MFRDENRDEAEAEEHAEALAAYVCDLSHGGICRKTAEEISPVPGINLPIPDRSQEFLDAGADPKMVKIWRERFIKEVAEATDFYQLTYSTGIQILREELVVQNELPEALLHLAEVFLENLVQKKHLDLLNLLVEDDLALCRRGKWFVGGLVPKVYRKEYIKSKMRWWR